MRTHQPVRMQEGWKRLRSETGRRGAVAPDTGPARRMLTGRWGRDLDPEAVPPQRPVRDVPQSRGIRRVAAHVVGNSRTVSPGPAPPSTSAARTVCDASGARRKRPSVGSTASSGIRERRSIWCDRSRSTPTTTTGSSRVFTTVNPAKSPDRNEPSIPPSSSLTSTSPVEHIEGRWGMDRKGRKRGAGRPQCPSPLRDDHRRAPFPEPSLAAPHERDRAFEVLAEGDHHCPFDSPGSVNRSHSSEDSTVRVTYRSGCESS